MAYKYNMELELNIDDWRALAEKAGREGLTIKEVIEGFLNDLVAGDQSHGSDERMIASEYFNRAYDGFLWDRNTSFLTWLIDNQEAEFFADDFEAWVYHNGQVEAGTPTEEDKEQAKERGEALEDYYNRYVADLPAMSRRRKDPEPMAQAFRMAAEWCREWTDIENEGEKVKE